MKRVALALLPALFACLATTGCSDDSTDAKAGYSDPAPQNASPAPGPNDTSGQNGSSGSTGSNGAAQEAIEEADIVEIQDGRLYAISKSGTLTVIDVSQPGQLALKSQALLPGEPFEMYLSGSRLVLLMKNAKLDASSSSAVLVLDVSDPVLVQRVGTFPIAGEIADSRMTGDLLYLVTGSSVTSFDLADPRTLREVDRLPLDGAAHSIIFGNGRMYVGGQGGIDLVDVSDPKGKLGKGTHVTTAGPITERWQMSEKDDVLRVVSQPRSAMPVVETFTVWNARSMQAMAKTNIQLPIQEDMKSVRFDADRAYVVTFRQTDPLFLVDLSQPAAPQQRGELVMPGWMVYLEPRGDRLIGLGVDPSDAAGHLNVSLFDVSNMDHPTMLKRVSFGMTTSTPEDQDRLQKAIRIGADGLITVPYSGPSGQNCATGGMIQLVKLDNDTLYEGQQLPMAGNPRRALVNQDELVAVSDSNVTAFDISTATKVADVQIGQCEVRTDSVNGSPVNRPMNEGGRFTEEGMYDDTPAFACSSTRRGGFGARWGMVAIGLGAVASGIARRRASRRSA